MIEVKKLTKKFGSHTAVDGISFTVNDGEILGFLGPNGAGKTTTMNMMTGFISSTEGEVKINGFDILSDPINAKRQLGYLPDVPPLYGDLTVEENLKFVCDLMRPSDAALFRAARCGDIRSTVSGRMYICWLCRKYILKMCIRDYLKIFQRATDRELDLLRL